MFFSLSVCACPGAHYKRHPRRAWMQLFWSRRLYRCTVCNAFVFASKTHVGDLNRRRIREAWLKAARAL